jgi:thiol-disulfide isomerase/thioredoxin
MSSPKNQRRDNVSPAKFWTPTRIGVNLAILVTLTLIATAFIKGKRDEAAAEAVAATNTPTAGTTRRRSGRMPLAELSTDVMSSKFEMLSGKPAHLADYAGKVVVLNLWATWCGPCRIEIPHLVALAKEFKDRGVEVIGLTTEDKVDADEAVKDFVKSREINYPIGWANQEISSVVLNNSPSIPQSIIIGKDGKLYRHLIGFNPTLSPPMLRATVEEAVAK